MTTPDPIPLLPPLRKNYTYQEALAALDEVYAQLPDLECRGLCHNSCTVIGMSELERRRIAETGKWTSPAMSLARLRARIAQGQTPRCPALGPLNTCTVYDVRPLICRAFGVAEDLRCDYGCTPDKILPAGETLRIIATIEQLSRHVTGMRAWPPPRP